MKASIRVFALITLAVGGLISACAIDGSDATDRTNQSASEDPPSGSREATTVDRDQAASSSPEAAAATGALPGTVDAVDACWVAGGVCISAFECHHGEGTNIHIGVCGTNICCRF